jgi:hypothetical protein
MPELAGVSFARRCSLSRDRFPVALLFCGLFLAACLMPAQSDTWWQLRAGEWTWDAGRPMLRDEFTHTVEGQPWPNHEWLSNLLFFLVYKAGGLPLLTAVCAAAVTLAWALAFRLTRGPVILRVALTGAGALLSSPAWCLRPQVLTLTMVAITLTMLIERRRLWLLPGLFVVWANLHGAVALGGVMVFAAWLAHAAHDRRALPRFTLIAFLCLMATAVTPLGFTLWLEVPHSLGRLQDYGVIEWRPPSLANPLDLPFFAVAAILGGLAFQRRARLSSIRRLTLTLAAGLLFVLATRSLRNVPPFMIVALAAISDLFAREDAPARETPRRMLVLNAATLAIVGVGGVLFISNAWSTPLPRLGWKPVEPVTLSAIQACEGRLYNRYDEGGFLIWFLRDRKVFIDSRQDPFPPELVRAHIDMERTGEYSRLFARYDIACALTPTTSPLAQSLARDGWSAIEAGEGWAVFSRAKQTRSD